MGPLCCPCLLDGALESLTFGNRGRIHLVARSEDVCLDLLRQRILGCVVELELSYISLAGNASLIEMALQRLVHAMSVNDLFLSALVSVDNSFLLVTKPTCTAL